MDFLDVKSVTRLVYVSKNLFEKLQLQGYLKIEYYNDIPEEDCVNAELQEELKDFIELCNYTFDNNEADIIEIAVFIK